MGLRILNLNEGTTKLDNGTINNRVNVRKSGSSLMAKWGGVALLLALYVLGMVGSGGAADLKEIAVISGKSFPSDALTLEEVKEIYRGERQLIRGVRIKPIDQRDTQPIRGNFLNKVMNFSGDEYVTYWNNRLFREGGIPPMPKNNSADVISAVQDTDGAIGYVWLDETTAAKSDLKILITIPVR